MNIRDALMAAILEHPLDDTPRLIFADYLEEAGEVERSSFIRVQVELARGEPFSKPISGSSAWSVRAISCHEAELDDKQELLLKKNIGTWLPNELLTSWPEASVKGNGSVIKKASWSYTEFVRFKRGFVEQIGMSWQDFQKHADTLLWWPARKCERCYGTKKDEDAQGRLYDCPACRGTGEIPGATIECPECHGDGFDGQPPHDGLDYAEACQTCSGSGRIPRPFTATVQPITEVTLTTWPGIPGSLEGYEGLLREHYPSIEKWNLPTAIHASGA